MLQSWPSLSHMLPHFWIIGVLLWCPDSMDKLSVSAGYCLLLIITWTSSPTIKLYNIFSHKNTVCLNRGKISVDPELDSNNQLKLNTWDFHEFHYIRNLSPRINIVSFIRQKWSLNKIGHTGKYNMMQQETARKKKQPINQSQKNPTQTKQKNPQTNKKPTNNPKTHKTTKTSKWSSKDIKSEKYLRYSNLCRSGFSALTTKRSQLLPGKSPETFILI